MEKINNHLEETAPALVVANPGTRGEKIYLIKGRLTFPSWAWFRSDVNLPRGKPTQVILQIKYGTEQSTIRVKFYGEMVRSGPGGSSIAFE
jgi:hypothetical protein